MQLWVEGLVILAMLALNAVFAAYEMALASISHARIEALVQLQRRGARSAAWMKARLERSLAVVQVGITLAGAIAAATGGTGIDKHLVPVLLALGMSQATAEFLALALFVLPLSALTIIFAELVPKLFALQNKEQVALALSPAMRGISLVFYPAIFILETAVKRIMRLGSRRKRPLQEVLADQETGLLELRAAASLARAARVIGPLEEKIVGAAVQFSTRSVREVMLPPAEMAIIPENASLTDALLLAHTYMHTRYPTCRDPENPQTITGYVNFKDIVSALRINPTDPRLKNIIRPLHRMAARTTLSQALEQMIRDNTHIAAVCTADGRVIGLITLEDMVAELVGNIGDEYDRLPTHIHPLLNGWIMGGGVLLETVMPTVGLPAPLPPHNKQILADWCLAQLTRTPRNTDLIHADGLEVQVRKIRRRKVKEALVRAYAPSKINAHA